MKSRECERTSAKHQTQTRVRWHKTKSSNNISCMNLKRLFISSSRNANFSHISLILYFFEVAAIVTICSKSLHLLSAQKPLVIQNREIYVEKDEIPL